MELKVPLACEFNRDTSF